MRAPNKWMMRRRIAADAGPTNDHGGEATPAPIAAQRTATATSDQQVSVTAMHLDDPGDPVDDSAAPPRLAPADHRMCSHWCG
jgi:hypothetical protein